MTGPLANMGNQHAISISYCLNRIFCLQTSCHGETLGAGALDSLGLAGRARNVHWHERARADFLVEGAAPPPQKLPAWPGFFGACLLVMASRFNASLGLASCVHGRIGGLVGVLGARMGAQGRCWTWQITAPLLVAGSWYVQPGLLALAPSRREHLASKVDSPHRGGRREWRGSGAAQRRSRFETAPS